MPRITTLLLASAAAALVSAQNTVNTLSYAPPEPKPCDSACAAFWDDDLHNCSRLQDQGDVAGSIECLCSDAFLNEMETCAACMMAHPEDTSDGRFPKYGLAGTAQYFEQQCGRPVYIPGLTPQESTSLSLSLPLTSAADVTLSKQQTSVAPAAASSATSQTAPETTSLPSSSPAASASGSSGFAPSSTSQRVSASAAAAQPSLASGIAAVASASLTSDAPRNLHASLRLLPAAALSFGFLVSSGL